MRSGSEASLAATLSMRLQMLPLRGTQGERLIAAPHDMAMDAYVFAISW